MSGCLTVDMFEASATKKAKYYDIESNRAVLQDGMRTKLQEVFQSAGSAMREADIATELASACEGVVDGVAKWQKILETRIEYLKAILYNSSDDITIPSLTEDGDLMHINGFVKALTSSSAPVEGHTPSDDDVQEKLSTIFSGAVESRALPILSKHSWNGEKFVDKVKVPSLLTDLQGVQAMLAAELHLKQFIEAKIEAKVHSNNIIYIYI